MDLGVVEAGDTSLSGNVLCLIALFWEIKIYIFYEINISNPRFHWTDWIAVFADVDPPSLRCTQSFFPLVILLVKVRFLLLPVIYPSSICYYNLLTLRGKKRECTSDYPRGFESAHLGTSPVYSVYPTSIFFFFHAILSFAPTLLPLLLLQMLIGCELEVDNLAQVTVGLHRWGVKTHFVQNVGTTPIAIPSSLLHSTCASKGGKVKGVT